jgi:hypothetical protein
MMIKDLEAEVTVVPKLNQGFFPKTCCISFSDGFLVTFFHKKVTIGTLDLKDRQYENYIHN